MVWILESIDKNRFFQKDAIFMIFMPKFFFKNILILKSISLSLRRIFIKKMKYAELERRIKQTTNCRFHRNGSRHPIWINPDTGEMFQMSHHKSQEVKYGTLKSIVEKSGVEL